MSLLIEHMDMPKNCDDCRLRSFNLLGGMMCCLVDENVTNQEFAYKRHPNCPLAEIPTPHGDLIDRDDLLAYFDRKSKGKTAEEALKLLYTALKAYPTVIEKEMN